MRYVSIEEIENALAMADTPQDWVSTLRALYESRSGQEPCSLMTVFVPSRKKRALKKPVVIGIVILILAAAVFFGLGAMRRRGPRPEGGPERPPLQTDASGQPVIPEGTPEGGPQAFRPGEPVAATAAESEGS